MQNSCSCCGNRTEALLRFSGGLADTEKLVSYKDQDNGSALHIAIWDCEPEFAKMMLDIFYAKATGAVLEDLGAVRKSNGETPLISAVRNCQRGAIAKLLALGADTEARDKKGDTALLVAVHDCGRDAVAILRVLLDPKTKNYAKTNVKCGSYYSAPRGRLDREAGYCRGPRQV
jgi:ankyrin repeat protein